MIPSSEVTQTLHDWIVVICLPARGRSDIITGTVCALLCIAYLAGWVLLVLAELVVSMFGACVMSVFLLCGLLATPAQWAPSHV